MKNPSRLILLILIGIAGPVLSTPAAQLQYADFNADGIVDQWDAYIFLKSFRTHGDIDYVDFLLFSMYWKNDTFGKVAPSFNSPPEQESLASTPNINLDMYPATSAIDSSIAINALGTVSDRTFEVLVVIENAVNMTGFAADILFDATHALDLIDIREVPGDLNLDGSLDLTNEVLPIRNQYENEINWEDFIEDFTDGYGRRSWPIYDTNSNYATDLDEVLAVEAEWTAESAHTGIDYWTRLVLNSSTYDESMEIFHPAGESNCPGVHYGLIDDLAAALLRRPDRTEPFGYTGTAIAMTLTFRVRPETVPGEYPFAFPQAKWIDNGFGSEADIMDLNTPATAPRVIVVRGSPAETATPSPTAVVSETPTGSPSPASTNTPSSTPTVANTPTPSQTPTITSTATSTNTSTPSPSLTPTITSTATITETPTPSPTSTSTGTSTPTPLSPNFQVSQNAAMEFPPSEAGVVHTSDIVVDSTGVVKDLWLAIAVYHDDPGELEISLQSPRGTSVTLWNRGSVSTTSLTGEFDTTLDVYDGPDALDRFNGETTTGSWILSATDHLTGAGGSIEQWTLKLHITQPQNAERVHWQMR